MTAICERLGGTLRHELLDRTLIMSEAHDVPARRQLRPAFHELAIAI
jgi:hypothetical protein